MRMYGRDPGTTEELAGALGPSAAVPMSNRELTQAISQPGDAVEVDAERVAAGGAPSASGGSGGGSPALPRVVVQALGTSGQALNTSTRSLMEQRFGRDLSDVRVHNDGQAGRSAAHVDAAAYTVGNDIVFGSGRYDPGSGSGQQLLAHELAHVVQPAGQGTALRRFHLKHGTDPEHQYDESKGIAETYAIMLGVLQAIIKASIAGGSTVDMDKFVLNAGGKPASAQIDHILGTKSTPEVANMLKPRYLLTRRAGLLDMRHFCELLYIAQFKATVFMVDGNRGATDMGRDHELNSESESRFGAEDTTSNAIGAFTGSQLAAIPQSGDLFNKIKAMIDRCDPVDFSSLSDASKDKVIHFYGDLMNDPVAKQPGDLIPVNQNETAAPPVLDIPEFAGTDRSFPFEVDPDDPDGKTISGTAFDGGAAALKDDDEVRDFVSTQKHDVIRGLPTAQKVHMVKLLFEGWVSDADIDAIESIYLDSSAAERPQLRAVVFLDEMFSVAQRTRLQKIFAT